MRQKRRPPRDYDDEDVSEDLAAVNDRLDQITQQLERVARSSQGARNDGDRGADRVTDALSRLDRRLEHMIYEGRMAAARPQYAPPPPAYMPPPPAPLPPQPMPSGGPGNWAAEISARQRALDGGAALPPMGPVMTPGQDLTGLEHQLRQITSQIATLHQPYEDALSALRGDLAEVGRALTEAMPRRAVEALEAEVRTLSERVDRSRQAGAEPAALTGLERGLAEVRDTLRNLKPAESLVGFEEAVRGLSHKIDQIGAAGQDPAAFHQLEQAIASLRGVVSNVASDGALAQLAAEVHGLANRLEQPADNKAVPPELEASIRALSERLDRMQLSKGDQLAIGSLEDRIAKLAEKLDASDAKLGNLGAIERGITDLLVHLEDMRNSGPRGPRAAAAATPEPAPEPMPAPPAPMQAPLAPPPAALAAPAPAPAAAPPPAKMQPPRPRDLVPIDPNLPPDTPLEPGSGIPKARPGSPAARIAASEAALGGAKPPSSGPDNRSSAVAAARNAARYADTETPAPKAKSGWFKRSKKQPKAAEQPPARTPEPVFDDAPAAPQGSRVGKLLKTSLIAASVVVILLMTLQTVIEVFFPPDQPAVSEQQRTVPPTASLPRTLPSVQSSLPPAASADPITTARTPAPPSTVATLPPASDITGSINRQPPPPRISAPPAVQAAAPPPAANPAVTALPPSVGAALRTAAVGGSPAAEYEIAVRYAEGRGVPQNLEESARWLDRAAKSGFIPAQFRLASLHEKGEGLKKDLNAARRLYTAAADKGHAKAMHNIAVLYAEGIDGKPDYKAAAQWFRKASVYGIADSQYNLAILYARGIGVEQNLAESYKWFSLAAAKGDAEAGKKRDEVARRLDSQTLMAAKLAAQTFTAEREPDEATNLKAPAGGWDRVQPASVQTRPRTSTSP